MARMVVAHCDHSTKGVPWPVADLSQVGRRSSALTQASCSPHPWSKRPGDGGGRTTPLQAIEACCRGHAWVCLVCLLYEVSSRGAGTARSHTAGCRYNVWTSCMRPCWQTGHTAPGSPADIAG